MTELFQQPLKTEMATRRLSPVTDRQARRATPQARGSEKQGVRYTATDREVYISSLWIAAPSELRSCVKVEVAAPGSPSLIVLTVSLGVK